MKKFSPSVAFLNRVNGLYSLLSALNHPNMRVVLPTRRASSRMFLDMHGFSQIQIERIINQARKLGLVNQIFSNPFIVGHGELFIGLTQKGADLVDGVKHGN